MELFFSAGEKEKEKSTKIDAHDWLMGRLSGGEINKQIYSVFDNNGAGIQKEKSIKAIGGENYAEAHMRST